MPPMNIGKSGGEGAAEPSKNWTGLCAGHEEMGRHITLLAFHTLCIKPL